MRKSLIFGLIWLLIVVWFLWHTPAEPSSIVSAEVVALEDVANGNGLRRITVRFEDGTERTIKTLVPFFYKPGYKARVAVHERYVFADVYRFVSSSNY